uniref:Hypothetical secreted protein n=1 Tax=Hottentotta judaicus TaxID=6863 RepID=F1CJ84_HOTJU|nr:hypothetical secreted protein [Hottentotta judaicus]
MDRKLLLFLIISYDFLNTQSYDDFNSQQVFGNQEHQQYLKQVLQRLDERLQQLGPDESRAFSTFRRNAFRKVKRPCFINLPGSDCDNMDIAGLAKDQGHWAGALSPGKKRRKRPCNINLPGSSCDNSEMIGARKDELHWANEQSPGRKRSFRQLKNLLHE